MKFGYKYRSSDNKSHEGVVEAKDRNDAYKTLKAKGLNPMKVWELEHPPNYKKFLWLLLPLLGIVIWVVSGKVAHHKAVAQQSETNSVEAVVEDVPTEVRKQLYGDMVTIEQGVRSDWVNILELEGERFLARYAQPGRRVDGEPVDHKVLEGQLQKALEHKLVYTELDSLEHKQLKRIVEGMKVELREVLKSGGTIIDYINALEERLNREESIVKYTAEEFNQLKNGKNADQIYTLWMRMNSTLKSMGLKTLPVPIEIQD